MDDTDRIVATLTDWDSNIVIYYFTSIKKNKILRTTGIKRSTSETSSNYEATNLHKKTLNIALKKLLVDYIERLLISGIFSMSTFVRILQKKYIKVG